MIIYLYSLYLFNSGSTSTLINKRAIPPEVTPKQGPTQQVTTTQGNYSSSDYFDAQEIVFPDFCSTRKIPNVHLRTFSSRTWRLANGIHFGSCAKPHHLGRAVDRDDQARSHRKSTGCGYALLMFAHVRSYVHTYAADVKKLIKDAKYESISPSQVASQCSHLNPTQQMALKDLLSEICNTIFWAIRSLQ